MVWDILTPFYRTHFSKSGSIDYADRLCLSIYLFYIELTHLSLVPHIYVNDSGSIGSYNGLLPIRCQAIIWGNDSLLSIGTLRTNISEIIIGSRTFSSKKMYLNFLNTICEMAAILSRERPPPPYRRSPPFRINEQTHYKHRTTTAVAKTNTGQVL